MPPRWTRAKTAQVGRGGWSRGTGPVIGVRTGFHADWFAPMRACAQCHTAPGVCALRHQEGSSKCAERTQLT